MVGIGLVEAHVVVLRDRQIVRLPPLVRSVEGNPQAAVIAGEDVLGVGGIDEHIVHIAVHADEAAHGGEALAAILAQDQRAVGLVDASGIARIDGQVREIERAPHHPLALVAGFPGRAAVVRNEKGRVGRLDEGVDRLGIARGEGERNASVGLRRQSLIGRRGQLGPGLAAVRAPEKPAAGGSLRSVAAGAKRPALAAKVPEAREEHVRVVRIHRQAPAAGRKIGRP